VWRTTPICAELGRAAADVDHEQLRVIVRRPRGGRAGVGRRGLLVAAQRAALEPEAVAHGGGELRAVGGVAHGRGHHGGARHGVVRRDLRRVALQRGEHAPLRLLAQPAGRLDALAQARDGRLPHALRDRVAGVHVGDQQARRVRADVDDRDAHDRGGRYRLDGRWCAWPSSSS
jgi:hypothetical protein